MSSIKVAVAGATGNLGIPVVKQLLAAKYEVTVLTRAGSNSGSKLPQDSNLKVVEVDYNTIPDLTKALQGHTAVVSAFASASVGSQNTLIDAAVAAGVQRFIPSEFGSNTFNPKSAALPVFGHKVQTQAYLKEKVKTNPHFSYTIFCNGAFLDWGLDVGFIVNPKNHSANVYDGGDRPASMTTLETIGKAVASVISHLDETKNRAVYVQDVLLTQNQLIAMTKKIDGKEWDLTPLSSAEVQKEAYAELKKENPDIGKAMISFLASAIYGEGYGGDFSTFLDNDLLGVKGLSEKEVEALIASRL